MFDDIYLGKKVLVFGHTGFKGSWLSFWLSSLGAEVYGFALSPKDKESNYSILKINSLMKSKIGDIREQETVSNIISDIKPDFIFHLAAQALVGQSYDDPLETWQTNVLGTLNILNGIRKLNNKCVGVLITSDKAYKNKEWIWGYRENDELGGSDPYSGSKAAAEIAINSFFYSFIKSSTNIRIASTRAGNVIGGGDWSQARIIPDCMRAWYYGNEVKIRQPNSTRPWQHVLEPLSGYLCLGQHLFNSDNFNGESFNFGPQDSSDIKVAELVSLMEKYWNRARWSIDEKAIYHEASLLRLNCDKASSMLNWNAVLSIEQTLKFTVDWYKCFFESPQIISDFTQNQINKYITEAKAKGLSWTN